MKPDYPIPYGPTTPEAVTEVLRRVHGFIDAEHAARLGGRGDERAPRGPRGGEGCGRPDAGRLPADQLRVGRRLLRHAARGRGDGRPALRAVRRVAPGRGRRVGALPEGTARPAVRSAPARADPPGAEAGGARRLGRHVGRDDQGDARGRREGPAALDRQLPRLDLEQGVPSAGRHARAQPAAAEHALARRPLHGRAGARADGRPHRRAQVLRRRGQAGPAVLRAHVQPGAGPVHARLGAGHGAAPRVPLGPRERLGHHRDVRPAGRAARGPPGPRRGARAVPRARARPGRAPGRQRVLAPAARPRRTRTSRRPRPRCTRTRSRTA